MDTQRTMTRSFARVLLVTGFVLAIPLVASQLTAGVEWSPFDYALAGGLIMGTGLLYELAVRRPGSRMSAVVTAVIAAVGGAAIVLGEVDDAPGLMLLGVLMIATAVVLGIRTARRGADRRSEGDPG